MKTRLERIAACDEAAERHVKELQNMLQELKELVRVKSSEELNAQWIESTEARKLLGVSQKTWQGYRDNRIIPFVQVGRKIYVKRGDLDKFMQDHYVDSK